MKIWIFIRTDKKVANGYKPQAGKNQTEKLPKQQLSLHPDSGDHVPGLFALPKRGCAKLPLIPAPPQKSARHRNGLKCCLISKQKAESAYDLQRADRVKPGKLPPLPNPERGLNHCFKIVSSWDW